MFRRSHLAVLLALGMSVVTACAGPETADADESQGAVELEKNDVEELVRLAGQLSDDSQSLEQNAARLAGVRSTQQLDAVRTDISALATAIEPIIERLRDRLGSPSLRMALKRAGYLDVPESEVRAQIDRLDDVLDKLQQLAPSASQLLDAGAGEAPLDVSLDEFITRAFAVAPILKTVTREFGRWLHDFAKAPVPEWEESFLTVLPTREPAALPDRVARYRGRLQELFPGTFKGVSVDTSDHFGIGFARFGGSTGGQDLRSHSVTLRGEGASLAESETAWFQKCLDQLANVQALAPAGRQVVGAGCGSALPLLEGFELAGVESKLEFVTIVKR